MARLKVLWCAVAMMLGTVTLASAEDKVAVGVTADVFSKYIWRGQNIVDDWVLQPGASVGYKGLTGSVWSNVDLTGEVDGAKAVSPKPTYALDYTNTFPGLDKLGYSVGTIYYSFLNTHSHPTAEVYGGLSLDMTLSPAVRWFYDFDADRRQLLPVLRRAHDSRSSGMAGRTATATCKLGASMGLAPTATTTATSAWTRSL